MMSVIMVIPPSPCGCRQRGKRVRIAVISDIHANLAALEAVLEDIDAENIGSIISLGDNIGYGPDPEEVMLRLRERGVTSIQGNHEFALLNRTYFNRMNPDPRKSLELTLPLLSPESLDLIVNLQPVMIRNGARFVHGCPPASPTSYLFYPSVIALEKIFGAFPERLCFYGHTHTLNFFVAGLPPEQGLEVDPGLHRLEPDKRYIINPGSVGQPRDGINNHAKYLIWDGGRDTVTFKAVRYEVMRTVNKLRRLGFPDFNAQRLLW
ncbi:MAG TPA: metallophosphoesterase [Desulfobacteraceae bacterium]|nr:metallophosphoesterase [Desulfobacteraceae bacterium]